MTQRDIEVLHSRLEEAHRAMSGAKEQLDRIEVLARETNGRVRELEMWRARLQGAASTSRVVWLIAGGGVTAIIIEIARGMSQ